MNRGPETLSMYHEALFVALLALTGSADKDPGAEATVTSPATIVGIVSPHGRSGIGSVVFSLEPHVGMAPAGFMGHR
jgi:hypothetical protein